MALKIQRGHESEGGDDTQFSVDYRVIDDTGAVLLPLTAMDAAFAAGEIDYGVEPIRRNWRRVARSEIIVPLTFSTVQYYNYVTWPGGGDPFTPSITVDDVAQILPPGPFEIDEALEQVQKYPADAPTTLVLSQTVNGVRRKHAVYPPPQNALRRISVPRSLVSPALISNLRKCAHHLNSTAFVLAGETIAPQCGMLLSGTISGSAGAAMQLELAFAIGQTYSKDWTQWSDGSTFARTMTGIKPFSKLTFFGKFTDATETTPGTAEYYGLWEHRVWPTSSLYATIFGAP